MIQYFSFYIYLRSAMINYILPILNMLINGFLLFKCVMMLSSYFEFEFFVLTLFVLFFVLVSVNAVFKSMFMFMTRQRTFNLLFLVQFLASILIMQLLGWMFTIYLTFVLMLIYLLITKQNKEYNFFLQMCGIVVGGGYLWMVFL